MEKWTMGRELHRGKKVPMLATGLEGLAEIGDAERLKAVFLRSGSGVLAAGTASIPLIAPAIVFLGREPCSMEFGGAGASAQVLFFHPRFVNDALSFEALADGRTLTVHEREDLFLLSPFLHGDELERAVLYALPGDFGFLETLVRDLRRELEAQEDEFWPCRARSFLLEILAHVQHYRMKKRLPDDASGLCSSLSWTARTAADTQIEPLVAYLMSNYARRITIKELAGEFSTNRTTIQKRFRSATGWSIAQYTIRLRIQMASLLLRDTTLSISEIVERTGFESPSHFSRMFKRYAELSPTAYRRLFHVPEYILDSESVSYG
jgi:AraC family L-rhamnose operon regulatory protein RhaS